MLKIVGTEDHKVVDEKVILDDDNKITPFGLKLVLIDVVLDMCLFALISKFIKAIKKK